MCPLLEKTVWFMSCWIYFSIFTRTDSETSSEWHKLRRFRNKFGMTHASQIPKWIRNDALLCIQWFRRAQPPRLAIKISAPWSPGVLERKRKNAREQRAEGWNLFAMNSLQEEFCYLRKSQRAKKKRLAFTKRFMGHLRFELRTKGLWVLCSNRWANGPSWLD